MSGQGRPLTFVGRLARRFATARGRRALLGLAALLLSLSVAALAAAQSASDPHQLDLELRIAFGGGTPQAWQGAIAVEGGELSLVRMLGLEPDTPGSVRSVAPGKLAITQRSPHGYDGVDIAVRAPRTGVLVLDLAAGGQSKHIEIPLTQLIAGIHSSELDAQKNRLLVRRTPGDRLRLVLERDSLVFETGETFRFSVAPHEASLPTDTALRCRVRLIGSGDAELWNAETDFRLDRSGAEPTLGPFECPLPEDEGVYRVAIDIVHPPRLGVALVRHKPLTTREIQLVAISPTPPAADETPLASVLEIDPAHPGWLDRLSRLTKLPTIPGFASKEPLGNDRSQTIDRDGQRLVELGVGGWQAYPLPLKNVGLPHVLEVEYPRDAVQALGISIVEPNAAGHIAPLGVDSGVSQTTTIRDVGGGLVKHRLVFWPRTKTPLVLLTNRHARQVALYGKLQVLAGPAQLPAAPIADADRGRLVAAYYDKPLFAENFGAGEGLDPSNNRTLDDWNTFFLGARRMIEELKYAGYNGAVISVACEGSALYPSQLLEPTPKYDMGLFYASGQDPLRKDVLEMLFRLFDREGLQLVPALQFATPLVELEQLRTSGPEGVGIELIGSDGQSFVAARGTRRGLAPYYNPLDERVRLAVRRVVAELAERYAHHDAFAGVSLQLSPETYAQLPGEDWGYDDRTIGRFTRDTKKIISASGAGRFAQRARQLQGADKDAWLAWRARQVATLYTAIERDLAQRRGNARLFLAGGEMLHGEALERQLRPTLPAQAKLRDVLLQIGIDPHLLRGQTNIVFLRPLRELAPSELAAKASHIELNRSAEFDDAAESIATSGVHLFHEPSTLRLAEFDARSPFGADKTHLFLAAQFAPSQEDARRHLVRSLAAFDPQAIVQGGWMLPLGQEEALRPVLEVYRALPPVRFERIDADSPQAHPAIARSAVHDGRAYVYLVNPTAWPVTVKLDLACPDESEWTALGSRSLEPARRSGDAQSLTIELAPYDLFALESTSARAQVLSWQATLPAGVPEDLRRRIDALRSKAIALRSARPLAALANADFEQPSEGTPPGWIHAQQAGTTVKLDLSESRGKQALYLKSPKPVVWVRSEPFAVPTTGRLSVWVWLKIKDAHVQPPLRLAIEARHRDKTYYRFASVGSGSGAAPLKDQWAPYLFQVDDLPTSDLTDLRIGFDLMGPGEVWIDDVQVFDTYFHDHEQDELLKMIALADLHLGKGNIADCQKLLEGYWARFLDEHITAPPPPKVADAPAKTPDSKPKEPPAEPVKQSFRDRVWNWVPKWR